jgi:hypothetical protein
MRSTGKKDKKSAEIVCQAIQQTENELSEGRLTRDRLTAFLTKR